MIVIFTGLPGSGKTLKLAQTALNLLWRNKKLREKGFPPRYLYSNIHFNEEVIKEYPGQVKYWVDPAELPPLRDADIIWDEIATHLDATQWQNMSLELKRWLQQHRKFGCEIYGTTQDFAQIDKSMRRLASDLLYMTKLFGSRDISPTMPSVKRPFGFILVRTLDPTVYDEAKSKFGSSGLPRFMFITKIRVMVFDTREEIKMGKYPPLRHIPRDCEKADCPFHKVLHV